MTQKMLDKKIQMDRISSSEENYDEYFDDTEVICPDISSEFYINATNIIHEFEIECRKIIEDASFFDAFDEDLETISIQ